jgi:hypothetical protein
MTKEEVSARLRALASDDKKRSETARLRDVFDDVEATLRAGVSQADVLAELHGLGFSMTMASFKSALQRLRKARAGDRSLGPSAPAQPQVSRGDKLVSPREEHVPEGDKPKARITNPADVRKARNRDIDLESLENGSDDLE